MEKSEKGESGATLSGREEKRERERERERERRRKEGERQEAS